jgi:hypothetical protein
MKIHVTTLTNAQEQNLQMNKKAHSVEISSLAFMEELDKEM